MLNQANIDSNQMKIELNQAQAIPNQTQISRNTHSSQLYEEINDNVYTTLPPTTVSVSKGNYTHLNFGENQKIDETRPTNCFSRLFESVKSSKKRFTLFLITCILVGILLAAAIVLIILGVASNTF
jgi:hypothetical protein